MKNKKELYIWIAFIAAIGVFILVLPTIDDYVSGRHKLRENTTSTPVKNTGKKPNNQSTKISTELSCSLPEVDEARSTISKSVVFQLNNDLLSSGVITKLYKFERKEDYDASKEELKKVSAEELTGTGFEITTIFDDSNIAYTVKIKMDYSKFVKDNVSENPILKEELDYSTTTSTLESYLKKNGYTCSKKTS